MSEAATDTSCLGLTSISCTSAEGTAEISVVAPKNTSRSSCSFRSERDAAWGERRARTRSSAKLLSSLRGTFAWATT